VNDVPGTPVARPAAGTIPGLFETMRVEQGVPLRLDDHLARLARSAHELGIPYRDDRARDVVTHTLQESPPSPVQRLRLAIGADGGLQARASPFRDAGRDDVTVVLASDSIVADDLRQRHKTTDRRRYDAATRWASAAGHADVVYLNEHGVVAEGAISNVFVRSGGTLHTPRVRDGALPGILRAALLASGDAVETTLTVADLRGDLLIGNALRGLRRARFDPDRRAPRWRGRRGGR
jgi:para-aminobenzoate synthetase / 4-amino-4-deoxychorismate lyase